MFKGGDVARVWLISSVVSTTVMGLAHAETAQEMRSYCQPVVIAKALPNGQVNLQQTFLSGWCWGAIGTLQNLGRLWDMDNGPLLHFCAPQGSTLIQYASIFTDFADRHPERLHEAWFLVALSALQEAFPCKQQ